MTGWPSITSNAGPEQVFVTHDAGKTWTNATGNLKAAAGKCANPPARPRANRTGGVARMPTVGVDTKEPAWQTSVALCYPRSNPHVNMLTWNEVC